MGMVGNASKNVHNAVSGLLTIPGIRRKSDAHRIVLGNFGLGIGEKRQAIETLNQRRKSNGWVAPHEDPLTRRVLMGFLCCLMAFWCNLRG